MSGTSYEQGFEDGGRTAEAEVARGGARSARLDLPPIANGVLRQAVTALHGLCESAALTGRGLLPNVDVLPKSAWSSNLRQTEMALDDIVRKADEIRREALAALDRARQAPPVEIPCCAENADDISKHSSRCPRFQ